MKAIISISVARFATVCVVALAVFSSCVDHRPLRNEVFNENVYLPKDFLTRENPHKPGSDDHSWLMRMTVVRTSFPDGTLLAGDYGVPRYIRFQFAPDKVEMVDDTEFAPQVTDSQDNAVTSPSLAPAVVNAWPGSHVDIQMKDNLDGERTNVIEENRERDWQKRQYFKADLTKAVIPDVNMLAWYLNDQASECFKLVSVSLVPGSVEIEEEAGAGGDDYLSWTVAVTYQNALIDGQYWCGDIYMYNTDRHTFTSHVKYSLWRTPKSDYQPVEYDEKDPSRKKLMAFETSIWGRLAMYYDPATGIWGAKSYMNRFDPKKPHTFYFDKSFPQKYKKHFTDVVAKQFNDMATKLNIAMRIDFKDWNHDGVERTHGDIRYSMLVYHDVPWNYGPGGMADLMFDPRTGEMLSGGFNIYNWNGGLAIYASYLEDYLKGVTIDTFDDTSPLPKSCTPGDVLKVDETKVDEKHKNTSLYDKLETYMGQKAEAWVPKRTDDFGTYVRMLLPDLRYAHPGYNNYVAFASSDQGRKEYREMLVKEAQFQKLIASIDRGESPFGTQNVLAQGAIENGLDAIKQFKEGVRNHFKLKAHRDIRDALRVVDKVGWELAPALARAGRKCKQDGTWETRDEWAQRVIDTWWLNIAVHEFGHSLGLRHNFYGSMDKPHFNDNAITSSIMEYSYTMAWIEDPQFQPHDMFSFRYIYGGADTCGNGTCDAGEEYQSCPKDCKTPPADDQPWLFCTDEHVAFSPFCGQGDIGTTPTEIIKNEIDKYEWQYKFRNFRTYRKFWETYTYGNGILGKLYPLRRFLNLWGIDWYASEIKNDLILLGVTGDEYFFANITNEFNDELGQANRLTANFYKAILQQSAGERSYATKFDTFYGDVTQQGIILDKYYALFMFIGIWPVDDYDPNIYSYLAFHESSFGNSQYWSDVQDITDSMIGGQYDVYPWFKPLAVLLFSQDTSDIMFSDRSKQKWIQMRRFDEVDEMVKFFGFDPRTECPKWMTTCKPAIAADNHYQVFYDEMNTQWIYYYLLDRNWHLVASKDQNPTAFKILWDQNEALNKDKYTDVDDYEIKYYLDYFEYFN